jgi:hypothetical protein
MQDSVFYTASENMFLSSFREPSVAYIVTPFKHCLIEQELLNFVEQFWHCPALFLF